MHTFTQKLYILACRFMQVFGSLLLTLLFLGSLLLTCYSLDMTSQLVLTRWDNLLLNLAALVILLAVLFGISRLFRQKRLRALTLVVMTWCLVVGALLVVFSKTVPAADAMSVYSCAEALASGDSSVISAPGTYLSYYPQQVGLMAFLELFFRLYHLLPAAVSEGLPAYHMMKCLYVLLACVIILLQKRTVQLLWKDDTATCLYLVLAGANLPFLLYTSFVYGEIPSFTAISLSFYFLARLRQGEVPSGRRRMLCAAAALLSLTLSVMLRKNSLILVIAVLLVVLFQWLKDRRHTLLLWGFVCGLCCLLILPVTQKCYEYRAGASLCSGVTATSYLAMGMQESSRANGWYNGFNFNTYRDTGLDTAATNAISREAIRERLDYFAAHPGYAARFYWQKHLSQWADGTYASRQATLATFGGRSPFFDSLYTGNGSHLFIEYCNLHQLLVYLGALLFALSEWKNKRTELPVWLGLIGVAGGFLFHIIWEANARYIFVYSLLLLPYAARGLALLKDARLMMRPHKKGGMSQ